MGAFSAPIAIMVWKTSFSGDRSPGFPGSYWKTPGFEDPIAQREANLLFSVLRAQAIGLVSLALVTLVLALRIALPTAVPSIIILLLSTLPVFAAMAAAHNGRLHWGSHFAILTAVGSTLGTTLLFGGLRSSVVLTLVFGPLVASILRGRKAMLLVGGIVLTSLGLDAILEATGLAPFVSPVEVEGSIVPALVSTGCTLCLFIAVLYIYSREVERANGLTLEAIERAMWSEKHLADLVRTSPDGIAVVDQDGILLSVNKALERMSGYSATELVGRPLQSSSEGSGLGTQLPAEAPLNEVGSESALAQLTLTKKDGSPYIVEANPRPLFLADGRSVTQVVIRDVTARVEAEKRQRTLEVELEDARRLEGLGRLAGGLAHDLRNMLTPILLNTQELREAQEITTSTKAMVDEVEAAATRAGELLSQILTFARRQELKVSVVDVNAEIRALEPMLRRLIRSNIKVTFELEDELRPIRVDKSQLGQVVVNLVANARDAMPSGGRLRVETRNVVLSKEYAAEHPGAKPGSYSCITVSDSGEGMNEQVRQQVFDPFFTTKQATEGVGLGLATVHGIVTQSGGTIHVTSEPGHGATFRIYLPSLEAEPMTTNRGDDFEAQRYDPSEQLQLLLVDDEELVRRPLGRVLRRAGLKVIEASSGEEALSLARQFDGRIDLLVTDVVMPHLSGPSLAVELSETRPEMKVLFLSGYNDMGMVRSGNLGQGASVLAKPFVAGDLLRKVNAVLKGSSGS